MPSKSRRKGKAGELEAAREVALVFNTTAHRGCQFHGGTDSPDIRTGIPGVSFEIKRAESFRIYAAIEQAERDAMNNIPVVLYRSNRKKWLAITKLTDLPRLASILNSHHCDGDSEASSVGTCDS